MAEIDDEHDKRDRSPKFPYINLTVALDRVQQIYSSTKGNAARLVDVASDWGVSPTSSSTLRIAAALLAYGLIADEGSGDARRIRLTPEAIRILNDTRPGVKEQLLAEAALRSPILAEYYEKWGRNRPSDGHAISSLKFDSGFTDRAARTFLGVYDDLLNYAPNQNARTEVAVDNPLSEISSPSQTTMLVTATEGSDVSKKTAKQAHHDSEREWLRVRISKDVTARIHVDGDVTQRMIERLIAVLQTQKELMDEDF